MPLLAMPMRPAPCYFAALVFALLVASLALPFPAGQVAAAETAIHEPFDGPEPSWHLRSTQNGARIVRQTRTRTSERTTGTAGHRSVERLGIQCPGGYSALLEHSLGNLPVLDELDLVVSIRSNRAGVQMAVEVVFPRSTSPTTDLPLRALVYSSRYSQTGRWQTLRLSRLQLLVERQARLLRATPGQEVDVREAYVDRMVLVVPGGANETSIEVDDLVVFGVLATEASAGGENRPGTESKNNAEGPLLQSARGGRKVRELAPVEVRRRGPVLMVAGKPFVPRILQYRGESFSMLAQLGFNGVWMEEVPSVAVLLAAHDAKLWVVCPPPSPEILAKIKPNGPWQSVLAWSLGFNRDARSLDQVGSLADETRLHDPLHRPLLVEASDRHRQYGRLADVMVTRRRPPLVQPPRRAKPKQALPLLGCSEWTSVDLEWSERATAQCQAFLPKARHLGWHPPLEIQRLVLDEVAAGARGFVFRTRHPLGGNDPESRRISLQLQILHRQLEVLETWVVHGKRTNSIELDGIGTTAWRIGRSRLVVLPVARDKKGSKAMDSKRATPAEDVTLSGIPEAASAFLLTPGGLLPLVTHPTLGGRRLARDDLAAGGLLLLSDDRPAIAGWKRRSSAGAEQAAKLWRRLALAELLQLESIDGQLATYPKDVDSLPIDRLKQGIRQCDFYLARKDYPRAARLAQQLRQAIAQMEDHTATKVAGREKWLSLPTQYSLRTLPSHVALQDALDSLPRADNLLAGGDFEGLPEAKSAGWTHAKHEHSSIDTAVQFTSDRPQQGQASLRLSAQAKSGIASVPEPAPVVWITSPRVQARPGSIVEITGWTRVAGRPAGRGALPPGELLVIDSLGGEEIGLRITGASDWQPFRLVRIVGQEGEIGVQFALNGPATADIDAVMIREVQRPNMPATTATKLAPSPTTLRSR